MTMVHTVSEDGKELEMLLKVKGSDAALTGQ